MGVGRIFSRGGALSNFSKNFLGVGAKVVKFRFSHLKLRKQPFFAEISEFQGGLPLPSDAHV